VHRRYPSLSDDGQPYLPVGWWRGFFSPRFPVRVVALTAIIAIIALLIANG
jgi:hypothetical protein